MKKDIHENYVVTTVNCGSCGNTFEVKSNKETLHLESCNQCHSAYTGKTKQITAAGRIDKFNKKYGL